ncbi:MAG: FeoB-associated Cys-rich membrane protein [Lachnospiraceae bacterium]|nr:FeoB-associated Cys-rich membrane protein [Lachnospiraceae bacterium]
MIAWITANLGTIVVSAVLIAVVTAVIFKMIKDKKNGISSCGGNCAHCGLCASCNRKENRGR